MERIYKTESNKINLPAYFFPFRSHFSFIVCEFPFTREINSQVKSKCSKIVFKCFVRGFGGGGGSLTVYRSIESRSLSLRPGYKCSMDFSLSWEERIAMEMMAKELISFSGLAFADGRAQQPRHHHSVSRLTLWERERESYKRFVAIGNENTVYYSYAHRKHLFDFEQKFSVFLNLIWRTIASLALNDFGLVMLITMMTTAVAMMPMIIVTARISSSARISARNCYQMQ